MLRITKKPSSNILLALPESKKVELLFKYCSNGDIDKVKKLLSVGVGIDIQDREGKTSLHFASVHRHIDIIELLLKYKADPNVKNNNNNNDTPLHLASRNGYTDLVELLNKYNVKE